MVVLRRWATALCLEGWLSWGWCGAGVTEYRGQRGPTAARSVTRDVAQRPTHDVAQRPIRDVAQPPTRDVKQRPIHFPSRGARERASHAGPAVPRCKCPRWRSCGGRRTNDWLRERVCGGSRGVVAQCTRRERGQWCGVCVCAVC